MNKNKHAIVQGIVIGRKNLIEFIVVAILLAFGVNLIAGHIFALTIISPLVTILVGAVLCFGSMLYLAASLFGRRVESRTYEAFLIYNKKKNEIIPVPRYEFSEDICEYLQGAFMENPALKTLWEKEALKDLSIPDQINNKRKYCKSVQILSEAAEYFVLDRLSMHLDDYFNDQSFKKEKLKEYGRHDVPEVLLTNRFLNMFSRPMEERSAFVDDTFREKILPGEVIGAYNPDGTIYEKFSLVLPKKSVVRRPKDNKIEIETEKLKISIAVRFDGYSAGLPCGFEENYMGINDFRNTNGYQLNIDIQVLMKLKALFTRTGWEYYHWVDSFLNKIEDDISKDAFLNRISWETTYTLLQCINRKRAKI